MTMGIPGAFIQIPLYDKRVHVRLDGRMAELLAVLDPNLYRSSIVIKRGRPVLYSKLEKALYGMP